ncbi:MAG: beta-glucosidase [Lentisphaerae bacterium]|nr:beta-glucosidase [Lentisphaerota bacterium]
MTNGFPKDFRWGAATASYQIEGAWSADGKGESIWDRFSHVPGNITNGDTGDVACDHYHRIDEDVALMKRLGINTYSFSISWPRIFPNGKPDGTAAGGLNQKGLDWYRTLARKVCEAGITPMATLYHWDLPQALQDRGGWANPDIVDDFEHYARTMFEALGEWVPIWVSHTEPWVIAWIGHWLGHHPPGLRDFSTALRVSHHLLLAHGRAKAALAGIDPQAQIGIKLYTQMNYPATDRDEDRAAAHRDYGHYTRWFLDPLVKGDYPADMIAWYRSKGLVLPDVTDDDRAVFANGIDFLGHSYYFSHRLRHTPGENWPLELATELVGKHHTQKGWRIWPQGLYDNLVRITNDYGKIPIIITENGVAFNDIPTEAGVIEDTTRIEFIRQHLVAARRAMADGVNLQGYIYWSLMDNFEWEDGYTTRFGLTYIDYETQKRTPKASFEWYRSLICGKADL